MALTEAALRRRQKWIGSSDVPAILGVSRYRNVADVYLEKTGQIEPKVTTNAAADWGDRLEPVLCEWLSERLGKRVRRGQHRKSPDGLLRAQLDGWVEDGNETVEVKTSGLFNALWRADDEGWGAEGTDELPFGVLAQVQFAMLIAGATVGHVAAFLGDGVGPRHYVVEPHPDLQAEIERRARAFWTEHVIPRVPPEDVPHLETAKAMRRTPNATTEVEADLIDRYRDLRSQEALVKLAKDDAQAALLAALGDAEEGVAPTGTVTYYADKRGRRTLRVKE